MPKKSLGSAKRKVIFLHPSFCFYAGIWGIIFGIVFGLVVRQRLDLSWAWLIVAGLFLLIALLFANIFMLPLAFCAGFIVASFRISFDLAGQVQFAELTGNEVTLSGIIMEDPDPKDNMMALRLSQISLRQAARTSAVENMWKTSAKLSESGGELVKNCVKNVEKIGKSCGENVYKYTTDGGKGVQKVLLASVQNAGKMQSSSDEDGEWTKLDGVIYVRLGTTAELERSDRIILRGKISDGFGTFVGSMYRPKLLEQQKLNPPDLFVQLKNWFSRATHKFISSPAAELGLGYLMGMKTGLPADLVTILQIVGMTHVVVASGAHLGILTNMAKRLFGKFSKFAGTFAALLMIVFFVMLVGFTPSMTRAGLVASLSLLVGYAGRKFSPLRLISLVAALTLLITPINLLNLGWQLSFASFFGILLLAPRIQKLLYGGKKVPWLAGMLITSVATSLVCAPILIYNFGSISFLSLVANLVILPTLPYAMLLVFLTGIASFWPMLAQALGKMAELVLNLHIDLVNFLSEKTMFVLAIEAEEPRIFLLYLPIIMFLVVGAIIQLKRKVRKMPMQLSSQAVSSIS